MTLAKSTFLIVGTLSITSCQDKSLIAKSTKLSADRVMVATMQTDGYGGPGNAAVLTTVSLGSQNGSNPTEIFVIEQNDSKSDHIRLDWTGNRTLRITVRDAQIAFQAGKSGGVIIETVQAA